MLDGEDRVPNAEIVSSWVADGTPAAEPVTVETPTPPASEPPAAEPTAPPTPAPSAPAVLAPSQEFVEARGDGETPFQIPRTVRVPQKRGDTVEYVPIDEVLRGGMRERDYQFKTADLARERQAAQVEAARLKADRDAFETERARLNEALTDPAKRAQFEEHEYQMANNPIYRQNVEDALAKRETDAELEVHRERERDTVVSSAVETALGWITDMAAKYPDVPVERVRAIYGERLANGTARLEPTDVRSIFESEAQYLTTRLSPLQQQMADLKAQLDALQATKAAEAQNAATDHALARAKTPPVTTGVAPAPSKVSTPRPFGQRELAERNREWARGG